MCNIITWIYTKINGNLIGSDEFGNKYFQSKNATRALNRKHRWVIYSGIEEPSKVPQQWFTWLHYQTDIAPANNEKAYFWEKSHLPNLTGTKFAHYPKGHGLKNEKRNKAIGDYSAWQPKKY